MRGILLAVFCAVALSGCAVKPEIERSDDAVAQAAYRHAGPPELRLYTMKNNSTGSGAHSALMVNGSQRVIFDPAGSFRNEAIIRRGDVIFGVTPVMLDTYTRFHARNAFHVQVQTLPVSAELAEAVLRASMTMGRQQDARCAASISSMLGQFPEFGISQTWFPNTLAEQFAQLPGVTSQSLREYGSDENSAVLAAYDPARVAAQRSAQPE